VDFDENPYAPPGVEPVDDVGHAKDGVEAWRDGKLMVVRKGAFMPWRCLKCGVPTTLDSDLFSRTLSWHRPIWFLLLLVSWIIFLLVYFFVRWQARITVGLCHRHRAQRTRAILLGWLVSLVGIGTAIAGAMLLEDRQNGPIPGITMLAGLLLLLGGMIGGIIGSQVLVPRRIDEHYVWLSKVSPDILAELPNWNQSWSRRP